MAITITDQQLRWLRLRAQGLHPRPSLSRRSVDAVMRNLCGIQAQDPLAACLAFRPRAHNLVAADIEHARVHDRSIIRTWCMRGTIHLLATEDVPWLLDLLGGALASAGARRREELGLDQATSANGIRAITEVLSRRGPLSRRKIAAWLDRRRIPSEGQATYHLLRLAGLQGLLCFGPNLDGEQTYVVLEDWARTDARGLATALESKLARRYLDAYGPAGPEDLAAWWGLRMAEARAAWRHLADELIELEVGSRVIWMFASRAAWLDESVSQKPVVHLLPGYDSYLLGYRERGHAVSIRHSKMVHPGGGLLRPAMLVDGVARATWEMQRTNEEIKILVKPFETRGRQVSESLRDEVSDLGRFFEARASLSLTQIGSAIIDEQTKLPDYLKKTDAPGGDPWAAKQQAVASEGPQTEFERAPSSDFGRAARNAHRYPFALASARSVGPPFKLEDTALERRAIRHAERVRYRELLTRSEMARTRPLVVRSHRARLVTPLGEAVLGAV